MQKDAGDYYVKPEKEINYDFLFNFCEKFDPSKKTEYQLCGWKDGTGYLAQKSDAGKGCI